MLITLKYYIIVHFVWVIMETQYINVIFCYISVRIFTAYYYELTTIIHCKITVITFRVYTTFATPINLFNV